MLWDCILYKAFKKNDTLINMYQSFIILELIILQSHIHFHLTEYASVGYMAKRIQMRKNRFLALQKMAEQKKNEAMQVIK